MRPCEKYLRNKIHNSFHLASKICAYLPLDIICSSKLTVFFELSEQIMSVDKYPCIFLRQMEAIVYIAGLNSSELYFAIKRFMKPVCNVSVYVVFSEA